jgi:UDP-GlcNAc:undecaprenyl-phosphate GlcNAc-1-phosphate transferase
MPYLLYLFILLVLLNLYFRIASRFNIVDNPCERSSHDRPVLTGGGIIFPIGLTLWFIWSGFQYPWFFAGLILISFVSFLDDLSHVWLWIRLVAQLAAIFLLLLQLELTPFPWWAWALALFTATGIINAFNFMDGINGITAGYSLSTLLGLWIVNNYQVSFVGNDLLYASGLAVALFGFYNFRIRARCFAGDVGSVSVSFILVFFTGKLILASGNPFYLMFLSIYGVDTFLTIVYRLIRHENIFEPHRRHLFQILANESGISHLKISSGYAIVQLIINLLIFTIINYLSYFYMLVFSSGIISILLLFYILVKTKKILVISH